ncbi:MerR family transcriptional regulator [Phenylobacterium sp.]|uniref:MerR family transcriptional regulator n=1 Tax=Phenylobacterium sp. TaxID=1871053 RepID=UPI002DF383F7|nr:MerR family transcriptional regulator [Phenylobacterium sp.]
MSASTLRIGPTYTLSDLIRVYGVTARALRFYEECGLITARRDMRNKRYYDAAARRDVELIVRLRRLGAGLPEIGVILEARRNGEEPRERQMIAGCLAALRADIEHRRAALEAAYIQFNAEPQWQAA